MFDFTTSETLELSVNQVSEIVKGITDTDGEQLSYGVTGQGGDIHDPVVYIHDYGLRAEPIAISTWLEVARLAMLAPSCDTSEELFRAWDLPEEKRLKIKGPWEQGTHSPGDVLFLSIVEYVGPGTKHHPKRHVWNRPRCTNMGGGMRLEGWCGCTNDYDVTADGLVRVSGIFVGKDYIDEPQEDAIFVERVTDEDEIDRLLARLGYRLWGERGWLRRIDD